MGEIKRKVTLIGNKGRVRTQALIDSGATNSAISLKLANKVGLPKLSSVKVQMADGRFIKGNETTALIIIQRSKLSIKLIIFKKMIDNLIIGQDFIQNHDIKIDFRNDIMVIPQRFRKRRLRL